MDKNTLLIVKVVESMREELKRLEKCVKYNGHSEITGNIFDAQVSLGHALQKLQ